MSWVDVAPLERLVPERGVAALVDGIPVAVFRLDDDEVVAIDHVDPFTGVPVLARGIVASVGDRVVVASPLHKQRFDLRTGECLEDSSIRIRTWPVGVIDGVVHVDQHHSRPRPGGRSVTLPTDEQIRLVQESFRLVEPIAEAAAGLFYDRLFDTAPGVRPLFATDLTEQGWKLMASLGVITRGLDDLGELLPVAAALAVRHVHYGVTPEHYEPVGEALLWTLAQGLGEAFTPEVADAWAVTYGALADAMIAAAYGEPAPN